MVLMEFLKYRFNRGLGNNLSFFRDRTGHEIDILYAVADKLLAVEVKSGETVIGDFFKGFPYFENTLKGRTLGKALVYGGDRRETQSGIRITDVFGIKTLLDEFA